LRLQDNTAAIPAATEIKVARENRRSAIRPQVRWISTAPAKVCFLWNQP